MSDLTIFPADIAEMSVSQLAALPPEQKREIDKNLPRGYRLAQEGPRAGSTRRWISATASRPARCVNPAAISAPPTSAMARCISSSRLPKKVSWNQQQLTEIAERIVASGEKVEGYLDIKLSVSESRFTNWPPALQQQFAAARTVDSGKPSFTLSLDSGNGHGAIIPSLKRTLCAFQVDDAGQPWFNASRRLRGFGTLNPRDALAKHVDSDDVAKRDIIDNLDAPSAPTTSTSRVSTP